MIPDTWTSSEAVFTPLTWAVILALPLVWPLLVTVSTALVRRNVVSPGSGSTPVAPLLTKEK